MEFWLGFGLDFEKMMRILLWVVLILFTIVTTKIAHYSSMAYLPLSFLASIELYKIYNGKKFNSFLKLPTIIKEYFKKLLNFTKFIMGKSLIVS